MKRTIINIDESKCDGCGNCVEGCHEGALQVIDGKARLVSELFCDGLGACIGECPQDAITLEEREAEPYDETAVMERITKQGNSTVIAHMRHLRDHNEIKYFNQAIDFIEENNIQIDLTEINKKTMFNIMEKHREGSGCPGSKSMDLRNEKISESSDTIENQPSALNQWPVQMHLINPGASYFQNADVLIAADCVAFSAGNFHSKYLKDKSLAIACPKLDSNMEVYTDKITAMIDKSNINTLTVMIMEVPCCGALLKIAQKALQQAERKIPLKLMVIGVRGDLLNEQWILNNQ
jgi:ferredoxin